MNGNDTKEYEIAFYNNFKGLGTPNPIQFCTDCRDIYSGPNFLQKLKNCEELRGKSGGKGKNMKKGKERGKSSSKNR